MQGIARKVSQGCYVKVPMTYLEVFRYDLTQLIARTIQMKVGIP